MYKSNRYMYVINTLLVIAIIINVAVISNMDIDSYKFKTTSKQMSTYLVSEHIEKEIDKKQEEKVVEKPKEKQQENIKTDKSKTKEYVNKETKKANKETKKQTKIEIKKEDSTEENKPQINESEKTQEALKKEEIVKEKEPQKEEKVIEKLTGSLAGYGPDCYGCTSFRTASGRYIGDGKIYYDDKEYGTIRIVAADKKYPFGTIVKITNTKYDDNSPIYAIVLDRGGGVGIGKKFLFDLLFKTEKEAAKYGSRKNVTFEILRLGY